MILTPDTRDRLRELLGEYEPTYAVPMHVDEMRLKRMTVGDKESEGERVFLELEVSVIPPDDDPQRWLLRLDFEEDARNLLGRGVQEADLRTAALIISANIDEWWRCKDREPLTAAVGRRLS